MKIFFQGLVVTLVSFFHLTSDAQELEEIVVTAHVASSSIPGQHIRRVADNLLLRVQVVNDSREEKQRQDEIYKTLADALDRANRNDRIELSAVTGGGIVIPITSANYEMELSPGGRPDTSMVFFRAKLGIPQNVQDGEAFVLELKRFIAELKMTGRTQVFVDGDVEVSIVNPQQYRAAVIQKFANDTKVVTEALGGDYRVIVQGIDQPIEWSRSGSLSVAIYIPYSYTVVPTTVNAITVLEDY